MTNCPLILTESAKNHIAHVIERQKDDHEALFRIDVIGGGCSGFQYVFKTDKQENIEEGDTIFDLGHFQMVIHESALPFIDGATLDYVEDLIGAAFKIENPNASSSCGCGTSFSI